MKKILTLIFLLLGFALQAAQPAAPRRAKNRKARTAQTKAKAKPLPRVARQPFVTRLDAPPAPAGLAGRNIALWQSHGRYYDIQEDRWKWQRARLMGTVEDLYSMSYVLPYLIPMLENAGAYVMTPRERDTNTEEVIVDADGGFAQDGYSETAGRHHWKEAKGVTGFGYPRQTLADGENPFRMGTVRSVATVTEKTKASTAEWTADFPAPGRYAVYVSYASLPKSAKDARYRVNSLAGSEEFEVNQSIGGGTWVYLGTFPFAKGRAKVPTVTLSNISASDDAVVTADAVKIGGGMGNVVRAADGASASVSGYPRFTEGARYWLQWAGMPRSVYSTTSGTNDYEDDYKCRGLWVNYLTGGSSSAPAERGLGIPIDLSFALHTDAGSTADSASTIGTLPIVYTKEGPLGDGRSRQTNVKLAEAVTDQLTSDIRTLYEPTWNRRPLRDRAYHEAREPKVPSVLIELLSHQNFADMRYGLDPTFRFHAARAIYKGILKYLHQTDGVPYVVEPLPVEHFAITGAGADYRLSWRPAMDPLEPTAAPKYYIVYERIDDGVFTELAVVESPEIDVSVTDDRIYSYKVVAANDGGISYPSEILSLCAAGAGVKEQVTVVNGFTRISGPAEVYAQGHVGFDYRRDHGVPYVADIMFTGHQTEFRPEVKWTTNDSPGHGASHADYETEFFAGNTFDFAYVHGVAIRAAGYPFISTSVSAFVESEAVPRLVDLILGKQKEITVGTSEELKFKPFTDALKQKLRLVAQAGGAMMVSGSYIGTDLFDNPRSGAERAADDAAFGASVLGLAWRQAEAAVTGRVKEVKSRFVEFPAGMTFRFNQELSAECYAVESPESFAPADADLGAPILRYTENDYVAGVAYDTGEHRAVTLGFPFETVGDDDSRTALMAQILAFLTAPAGAHPKGRPSVLPETLMATEPVRVPPVRTDAFPAGLLRGTSESHRRRGGARGHV